jgi:hypothetical protein
MKKADVTFSTMQDSIEFWGGLPRFSFIGATLRAEGRIIGIGGFSYEKHHLKAFCDLLPEAYAYPKQIIKGGKMVMKKAKEKGLLLYAVRDESIESSVRFLEFFGFSIAGKATDGGEVWEWRN